MDKAEMFGISLETDDRTEEERSRQTTSGRNGAGSGLEVPTAPMDTDYQEEMESKSDKPKFNLGFDAGIRGVKQEDRSDSSRFTIERLFEAVGRGDVARLEGLQQYLRRTMKKLSDPSYESYGKTALMKALLHLRHGSNPTAEFLINISERMGDLEKFVNAEYTSAYYKGQTALHIAIERRSLSYVRLLVSKGADVHAKACGTFFQPHKDSSFYFGELPLSLAACTNQPEVVDFLMDNEHRRANANETDSQGNTVLHALVVVADNSRENTDFIVDMYDRILKNAARLNPQLTLEDKENRSGLTPLKLAAKTGKSGIFSHILKREFLESDTKHLSRKFTEWVYGPVTCALYDLASVDSYEDNSVLEILVYGSGIPNRHEMLETEPLSRLLEAKWREFAAGMFCFNFVVYTLYLIIFTLVAYNKKDGQPPFPLERDVTGYLYVSGQLVMVLANCYFFITGIIDMKRKRPKLQTLLIDGYYEILYFVQAVLFLVSAGLYLSGQPEYLGFLVVCLALSWVNLLYFSRGDKHMGIYSVMIQKMILSDILRFLFVYIVFLFGFSAAVVSLLIEPPVRNRTSTRSLQVSHGPDGECFKPSYRNISFTTLQLFKFTIGMGDMEFTQGYQYKEVFYVLLIGYIILTYILLLNMLIALMNRTVERITLESTSIWKLQRAITILDMEKKLPCCLKMRYRCGLERNLGTGSAVDRRRCFRVEEVNWNKWNNHLGKINEDPGCWDHGGQRTPENTPRHDQTNRGRSWRVFFTEGSRRWRGETSSSTEMSPLSSTPV